MSGDQSHELLEGKRFRSNSVERSVLCLLDSISDQPRHVLDVDWPDGVAAITGDAKDGKPTDEPGNVVDEYVFYAEDHGGAQDGVGQAGVGDGLFQLGLALVVAEWGFGRWVSDADVYDAPDPGTLCSAD